MEESSLTVNIIRIVERFGSSPDDRKAGVGRRGGCGVNKLHLIAVDCVTQ